MASLFERIGGDAAVDAAVDRFYGKILEDPLLAPIFAKSNMTRLKEMQKKFLTLAFGGPNQYTGSSLKDAHRGRGITEAHFSAVAGHLNATLQELGVPDREREEAMAIAASVKGDIVDTVVQPPQADAPQSPFRSTGPGASASLGSPSPQAWGQQGLGTVDPGASVDSLSAPSRPGQAASPWQYQLNIAAASRVRSGERSGISTPVLSSQRYGPNSRALSSGRTGIGTMAVQQGGKAAYESQLLMAVRKQIETFEQSQSSAVSAALRETQHDKKLQEAAFKKLEEKMSNAEGQQPELERKISGLNGKFNGLSDEVQGLIRRFDLMDERIHQSKRSVEEDFGRRHTILEQQIQKVVPPRVALGQIEETQRQVQRRLQNVEGELAKHVDYTRDYLGQLCHRCDAIDSQRVEDLESIRLAGLTSRGAGQFGDDHSLSEAHQRVDQLVDEVGRVNKDIQRMLQEAHDFHDKLASYDQNHKTLRTICDTNEKNVKSLRDEVEKVRRLEGEVSKVSKAQEDNYRQHEEHKVSVFNLQRRLEQQEQAQDELRSDHLARRAADREDLIPRALEDGRDQDVLLLRLEQIENRLGVIDTELDDKRESEGMMGRLSELVAKLQEINPTIIEHGRFIEDLKTRRLLEIEDKLKLQSGMELQAELGRVKSEMESIRQRVGDDKVATVGQVSEMVKQGTEDVENVKQSLREALHGLDKVDKLEEAFAELRRESATAQTGGSILATEGLLSEIDRLIDLSKSTSQIATNVLADTESTRRELAVLQSSVPEATSDLRKTVETLKQELGDVRTLAQASNTVKEDISRLMTKATSEGNSASVVAEEVQRLRGDLEGIQDTVKALQSTSPRQETSRGLPDTSGPQAEGWLERVGQVSEELQRLTAASEEEKRVVAETLQEMTELKAKVQEVQAQQGSILAKPASSDALDELRSEVATAKLESGKALREQGTLLQELRETTEAAHTSQQTASGVLQELEGIRRHLEQGGSSASDLQLLRQDVMQELKTVSETVPRGFDTRLDAAVLSLRQDLDELARKPHASADVVSQGAFDDVTERLKQDIAELRARSAKDTTDTAVEGLKQEIEQVKERAREARSAEVEELAQDEEEERRAHTTLLMRVDELCERLHSVDLAIENSASAAPQAPAGIPAVFADKIEAIVVNQVDQRLEAKLTHFTEGMQASRDHAQAV